MNDIYIVELKSQVESNLTCANGDMVKVCLAIIDHVSIGPSKKPHLTFAELYRISPKVNEYDFYEAVFYLTKKNTNVLKQHFEALDPRTGCFTSVPDREDLIEAMREGELHNPFVGDDLSDEEFGKQVITYFSPSEYFVKKVND